MRGVVHDGGGQRVVRHHVRDGAGALVLLQEARQGFYSVRIVGPKFS